MLEFTLFSDPPRLVTFAQQSYELDCLLIEHAPHVSERRRHEIVADTYGTIVMPDYESARVLQNYLALYDIGSYWCRIEKGL